MLVHQKQELLFNYPPLLDLEQKWPEEHSEHCPLNGSFTTNVKRPDCQRRLLLPSVVGAVRRTAVVSVSARPRRMTSR